MSQSELTTPLFFADIWAVLDALDDVRMKSRIKAEDVKSHLFKHVANFEFVKLGRFGPTLYLKLG